MIQMRDIRKSFSRPDGGRLQVLKGIDCDVRPGEFVAIVGSSGSGKSTLMNILGLLDQPDEGRYELAGEAISGQSPTDLARMRNRKIGFVFQQFHLLPRTTAVEPVELPLVYSDAAQPQKLAVEADVMYLSQSHILQLFGRCFFVGNYEDPVGAKDTTCLAERNLRRILR